MSNTDFKIDDLWKKARTAKQMTKKCHYMPQFLQRRWARGDWLHVQDIAKGTVTRHRIKKSEKGKKKPAFIPIGYEIDLYTTWNGNTANRAELEAVFGGIENETAKTLKELTTKDWVMSEDNRRILSIFVASMVLRLPNSLKSIQAEFRSDLARLSPGGEQKLGNTAHALIKVQLKGLTERLLSNTNWTIIRYPNGRQHTGDIPLIIATRENEKPSHNPDDWEIHIPLDPHALLTINGMRAPNERLQTGTMVGIIPLEWNANGATKRIL